MSGDVLINSLFVFMLAGFVGFQVIKRVSPLLHTPLMSLTNALDAIAVVGAILLAGRHESKLAFWLGMIAIVAATSNIVGGFLITDRMLKMFKSSRPQEILNMTLPANFLIEIVYLIATALFVFSLMWLSAPTTARRGVLAGEIGMALAIGGTLFERGIIDYQWVAVGAGAGRNHRRAAWDGADDRGSAADGAQPCVWRVLRHAGGHGGVLLASIAVSRNSRCRCYRWK